MGIINDLFTLSVASEGECIEIHNDVPFFIYTGNLEKWDKEFFNTAAIMKGENVLVRSKEDYTPRVIKHELKHIEQLRRYKNDLIFRTVYLLAMLKAKIQTGNSNNNMFELEAVAAEQE
jgi:hypothetical protein